MDYFTETTKQNEAKGMEDLLADFNKRQEEAKKNEQPSENKAVHERAYWVELTRKALGKNKNGKPYTFGQINGLTRDWSVQKLSYRYQYCTKQEGAFGFIWFGMRKQDKEKKGRR